MVFNLGIATPVKVVLLFFWGSQELLMNNLKVNLYSLFQNLLKIVHCYLIYGGTTGQPNQTLTLSFKISLVMKLRINNK